jgi:hypothetical protein
MKTARARASPGQRLLMMWAALIIGIVINFFMATASGSIGYLLSNLGDEAGPLIFNILLPSVPFLLLAMRGITAGKPWLVGLILTMLTYGYVIFTFLSGDAKGGTAAGKAIWLALVLLVSSIVITITCHIISRTSRRPPVSD